MRDHFEKMTSSNKKRGWEDMKEKREAKELAEQRKKERKQKREPFEGVED